MKKLFSFTRSISYLIFYLSIGLLVIFKNMLSKKLCYLAMIAFIVSCFLCAITRAKKSSINKSLVPITCTLCMMLLLPSASASKGVVYDTNTETGLIQQEIYEQSGVYTFYNVDVKSKKHLFNIFYNEDYRISEQEALTSLKNIKDVLAIYSGGLPREIYIVNGFKDKKMNCGGAYLPSSDIIVLVNQQTDYFVEALHHEIGHSIEDKSLDAKSLYKFATVQDSCKLVSGYACTNNDELFAETWRYAMCESKTTNFSLAISNIFKKNIRFFDEPNYIDLYEFNDALNQLINKEIDSFVIKKSNGFSLGEILIKYPDISKIHFLDVGDEMLFY